MAGSSSTCLSSSKRCCRGTSCILTRLCFYGSFCVLALLLTVSGFVCVPVLAQMLTYTFCILVIGAHMSLQQNERDENGDRTNKPEALTKKDAMLFPIFGSCALCSLYLAYKFLDPLWVNFLLALYLTVIGLVAFAETTYSVLSPLCPLWLVDESSIRFRLLIPFATYFMGVPDAPSTAPSESTPSQGSTPAAIPDPTPVVNFSYLHVLCYVMAGSISIAWMVTKNWVLHNILAIAFCIQAIGIVTVGNFTVAAILLLGLFVYDVFWVFGTDVMVTVAKSFEGPAKLIFPVSFDPWQQSILGLGDIVIPGVFISMCLRFDLWLVARQTNVHAAHGKVDIFHRFAKFYFWVVMIFYELGLLTTGIVMFVFKHPQPALLYLVPFCLFALFGSAALNGQVKEVMTFSEDDVVPEPVTDAKKEK